MNRLPEGSSVVHSSQNIPSPVQASPAKAVQSSTWRTCIQKAFEGLNKLFLDLFVCKPLSSLGIKHKCTWQHATPESPMNRVSNKQFGHGPPPMPTNLQADQIRSKVMKEAGAVPRWSQAELGAIRQFIQNSKNSNHQFFLTFFQTPAGGKFIGAIAKHTFSSENVDFLMDIKKFKISPTQQGFEKIFHEYIKAGADKQVNVSSSTRNAIEKARGNISGGVVNPNVFSEVEGQVIGLLYTSATPYLGKLEERRKLGIPF